MIVNDDHSSRSATFTLLSVILLLVTFIQDSFYWDWYHKGWYLKHLVPLKVSRAQRPLLMWGGQCQDIPIMPWYIDSCICQLWYMSIINPIISAEIHITDLTFPHLQRWVGNSGHCWRGGVRAKISHNVMIHRFIDQFQLCLFYLYTISSSVIISQVWIVPSEVSRAQRPLLTWVGQCRDIPVTAAHSHPARRSAHAHHCKHKGGERIRDTISKGTPVRHKRTETVLVLIYFL